jgi:small-conductance mechanosensitive channel
MRQFLENRTVRALGIVALIALAVVVLSLEPVLAATGGLLRIGFFLAIAFFLFLVWRERRGDLEAWGDWNRKLFYASIVLLVVAIGLAIGYGLPETRDALALVAVVGACAYVLVRVWRAEHRY